jgi:2-amino-4-hydroxy-6-hydroxymethyldihydropteridine diphosphokinase
VSHTVYLALGTNLGDRERNLRAALGAMPPQLRVRKESRIYETPPWGFTEQPPFLNMAAEAETELEPLPLLDHLKALEVRLGRSQTFRYGPRLIDLDILFYDDRIVDTARLSIPHPRLMERAFVLLPLNDIAPELVHPVLGRSVQELLKQVDAQGIHAWGTEGQDASRAT